MRLDAQAIAKRVARSLRAIAAIHCAGHLDAAHILREVLSTIAFGGDDFSPSATALIAQLVVRLITERSTVRARVGAFQ